MRKLPGFLCSDCDSIIFSEPICPSCHKEQPWANSDQKIVWRRAPGFNPGTTTKIVGWDQTVCVPTQSGMAAYNSQGGELLWRASIGVENTITCLVNTPYGLVASVRAKNQEIGNGRSLLQLYHPQSGAKIQEWEIPCIRTSSLAVQDQFVCFWGSDHKVYALDLKRRSMLWVCALPEEFRWEPSAPLLSSFGILIISNGPGALTRIGLISNGKLLWQRTIPVSNFLTLAHENKLFLFSETGIVCIKIHPWEILKKINQQMRPVNPPVIEKDALFFCGHIHHGRKDYLEKIDLTSLDIVYKQGFVEFDEISPIVSERAYLLLRPEKYNSRNDFSKIVEWDIESNREILSLQLPDRLQSNVLIYENRMCMVLNNGELIGVAGDFQRDANIPRTRDFEMLMSIYAKGVIRTEQKNLIEAAQIFDEIECSREAIVLYKQLQNFDRAIALGEQYGQIEMIKDILRERNQYQRLVQDYLRFGLLSEALEIAEKFKIYELIGQIKELQQDFDGAIESYLKASNVEKAVQLAEHIKNPTQKISVLLKADKVAEAARLMEANGQFPRAVEFYKRAKLWSDALRVAEHIEDWDQVYELARQIGDREKIAFALRKLNRDEEAGDIYLELAQEIDLQSYDMPNARAGEFFGLASHLCSTLRDSEKNEWRCRAIFHGQYPKLVMHIQPLDEPILMCDDCSIPIRIYNIGWGKAKELKFKLDQDFLAQSEYPEKAFLDPGGIWKVDLPITPKSQKRVGSATQLIITLQFSDLEKRKYTYKIRTCLAIAKDREHFEMLKHAPVKMEIHHEGTGPMYFGQNFDMSHDNYSIRRGTLSSDPGTKTTTKVSFCRKCNFDLRQFQVDFPEEILCPRCLTSIY